MMSPVIMAGPARDRLRVAGYGLHVVGYGLETRNAPAFPSLFDAHLRHGDLFQRPILRVALRRPDGLDHRQPFHDAPEDRVLAVQPMRCGQRDEELTAGGVRPG